jgi:hypothetical protein
MIFARAQLNDALLLRFPMLCKYWRHILCLDNMFSTVLIMGVNEYCP